MIVLRREQMEALALSRLGSLAVGLGQEALRRFPDEVRHLSAAEIDACALAAITRAWKLGFRQWRHLRSFTLLAFAVGPAFDQFPPFAALLSAQHLEPAVRFETLFRIAGPEDWRAAALVPAPAWK